MHWIHELIKCNAGGLEFNGQRATMLHRDTMNVQRTFFEKQC